MKTKKRWIENTIKAAAECDVQMPWERGARRKAFISRRTDAEGHEVCVSLAPMPSWMMEAVSA